MEKDFTEGQSPTLIKPEKPLPRTYFKGDDAADSFAIAVDQKGKLGWSSNEIDGDHIIEVLTEAVSDAYLNYLRSLNISYIFAGQTSIDFGGAFSQLYDIFGIRKLMLEGGGNVNGSVLHAGLIDEISLLMLPIADGTEGAACTFDVAGSLTTAARNLRLLDVTKWTMMLCG